MKIWDNIKNFFGKLAGAQSQDLKHFDLDKAAQEDREERKERYRRSGRGDYRGRSGGGPRNQGSRNYGRYQGQGPRDRNSSDRGGPRQGSGPDRGRGGRDWSRGRNRQDSRGPGRRPFRDDRPRQRPAYGGRPDNRGPQEPSNLPREERKFLCGTITHFFDKANVAVVKVQKGALQVNDLVSIEGSETNFRQKITSLQIDHQNVNVARVGQEVGLQVQNIVKEGDQIFRVDYVRPS